LRAARNHPAGGFRDGGIGVIWQLPGVVGRPALAFAKGDGFRCALPILRATHPTG
jgi:hypothetical protein